MDEQLAIKQSLLNSHKELERIIKTIPVGKPPSLLLHSCCGPCSSYVLEYLSDFFDITLFYYNPNISLRDEYLKRLSNQRHILDCLPVKKPIKFIEGVYEPEKFLLAVKGMESESEGGRRCDACFHLRLEATAKLASEICCDYFCTTLSVSPHKNANKLAEISREVSMRYRVTALPANFKKNGGYKRSIQLSHEYNLYRQEYCGCAMSMNKEICPNAKMT